MHGDNKLNAARIGARLRQYVVAMVVTSVAMGGCESNTPDMSNKGEGKDAAPEKRQAPENKVERKDNVGANPQKSPATGLVIMANNYSGQEWMKGVRRKNGRADTFYYLAEEGKPAPRVGDTLTFSRSGKAKVTKVDSTVVNGRTSVFVTVDKNLDPAGDGFPHEIIVE
jgi:hypothetical protein